MMELLEASHRWEPRQPGREAPRSVKLSFLGKGEAEWEGGDFKSDQKPIAMHKALD